MGQYRKKPVVIEAEQWTPGQNDDVMASLGCFIADQETGWLFWPGVGTAQIGEALIATLEGGHIVSPGDWVITGVKGERYPCKPDIFEMTYEAVN